MPDIEFTKENKCRQSNLELFRIICMLVIVAHHYVVNSGLMVPIRENLMCWNSLWLLIAGWGGKTCINCFLLITGYFMCTYEYGLKKFWRLLFQVYFYRWSFYGLFLYLGYEEIGIKSLARLILPVTSITDGFTACFLVFYLFIPFINKFIKILSKEEFERFLLLVLIIYTVLPSFLYIRITFNYVTWFSVVYCLGAYIRLYPVNLFTNKKFIGLISALALFFSWLSVICFTCIAKIFDKAMMYYWVADSNMIMALLTSVSMFLLFKNIDIGYSKFINTIAESCFGVLLIHSNSNAMRTWLWKDVLNNIGWYGHRFEWVHMIFSVLVIYIICTLIDYLRIRLVENNIFR